MNTETFNEEMLRRYLLDDISEEERQIIEERFLQDDSFFDEMLSLENELYFDYRQNRLSARESSVFEQKFLQSPEDHEKSAFANAFVQATAQIAEEKATAEKKIAEDSNSPSWRQSIAAFFNFSTPALQFGFAAASILFLLGIIGFFIQNARRQDETANLENSRTEERQQQEQIITEKQQQQAELKQQLENEKLQSRRSENETQEMEAERLRLEPEVTEAHPRINQSQQKNIPQSPKSQIQQAPQQRSFVALILSPGLLTRSGGEGAKRVTLSPSVKNLQLRLMIKNEDDYKSYRVALKTVDDGTQIWTSADLKPEQKGKSKSLSLRIPAKNLQSADYEISLLGITASGVTEEITNYYFSVVKSSAKKL